MADVQTIAADVAAAPSDAVVAGIETLKTALDSVKDLVDAGEASADSILDVIEKQVPALEGPLLDLLHLSTKQQSGG